MGHRLRARRRWAKPAAVPALVAEFRRASEHPCGYKWAVGAALACVADEGAWEDMVALVCDPRHGHARQMLVAAVGRMRRPRADDVLLALLSDGDAEVVEQAALALGRRNAPRAAGHLAALRAHEDRRVRAAAVRALAMIERARERMDPCADGLASREAPSGMERYATSGPARRPWGSAMAPPTTAWAGLATGTGA